MVRLRGGHSLTGGTEKAHRKGEGEERGLADLIHLLIHLLNLGVERPVVGVDALVLLREGRVAGEVGLGVLHY